MMSQRKYRQSEPMRILPLLVVAILGLTAVSIHGSVDLPLEVDVWLDREDGAVYHGGEEMTVYFETSRPAYVTVYNIDTEGYVNILYPFYRGMDNYVAGGRTYAIPGGGYDLALLVDEPVGIGHIEAVASDEPFHLEDFSYLPGAGETPGVVETVRQVTGDPFLAIDAINREILPYGDGLDYRDDFAVYHVEEIVHYPRYVCSDCHVPSYYHYDPYAYSCPTYYVVVYDTWFCNDFYYHDYYYGYDYYAYYYRYPVPSHVGHHYSRKYGYRTRDSGIYRTKGESAVDDDVIRVRGYADVQANRDVVVGAEPGANVVRTVSRGPERRVDDRMAETRTRAVGTSAEVDGNAPNVPAVRQVQRNGESVEEGRGGVRSVTRSRRAAEREDPPRIRRVEEESRARPDPEPRPSHRQNPVADRGGANPRRWERESSADETGRERVRREVRRSMPSGERVTSAPATRVRTPARDVRERPSPPRRSIREPSRSHGALGGRPATSGGGGGSPGRSARAGGTTRTR